MLTKANTRATVHRAAYLDYVASSSSTPTARSIGERRFLGLFASSAYTDSVQRIPVVRRKVQAVLERSGFAPDSHSGKDLLQILETYPRDELFQISVDDLYPTVIAVMHLQERRRTRLFLRLDDYGRFVSCLVFLPRDRYTTSVRLRMEEILREAFNGGTVDYSARVSESRAGPAALRRPAPAGHASCRRWTATSSRPSWSRRRAPGTRTSATRCASELRRGGGRAAPARLGRAAFPEAYKEDFPARVAVADLRRVEDLAAAADAAGAEGLGMNLYEPVGAEEGERRFKLYRLAPLSLTRRPAVPVEPGRRGRRRAAVRAAPDRRDQRLDLRLRPALRSAARRAPRAACASCSQEAFAAAWSGRAESDGFDRLVLLGELSWRQVVVLRAYAKYLRQVGTTFSKDYIERALRANVEIARLLVRLFEARFDPDVTVPRPRRTTAGPGGRS